MVNTVRPDHTGMLDRSRAKPGQLDSLFASGVQKYNQNHGDNGRFTSGSGGGGGGGIEEEPFKRQDNLNGDEYVAVRKYCSTEYVFLNSYLRNPNTEIPEKYQWMTQQMDSAIAKQPGLPAGTKLYRGFKYSDAFGNKKPEELVGAVITDKGFMSTSTAKEVAEKFGSARVSISVPEGYKGLDITKVKNTPAAKVEREIILPRGTKLQITSVSQTKGSLFGLGKKTDIEAKVVTDIKKYNQCHGDGGRFCSGSGGGGGGGGASLTAEEGDALDNYTRAGFGRINHGLRHDLPLSEQSQEDIKQLDSAMAKKVIEEDTVVYRGYAQKTFKDKTDEQLRNAEIVDKAYVSTTKDIGVGQGFAKLRSDDVNPPVIAEIKIPSGTHGLDITKEINNWNAENEKEVLLPRNTKFKVTGAEIKTIPIPSSDPAAPPFTSKYRYLTMEVVGVNKEYLIKFNQNHGDNGRFTTGTGGGKGGGKGVFHGGPGFPQGRITDPAALGLNPKSFKILDITVDNKNKSIELDFVHVAEDGKGTFRSLIGLGESQGYKWNIHLPVERTQSILNTMGYGPQPGQEANWVKYASQVKKYNQCHGDKGRFCSGSGGGGGGSGGAKIEHQSEVDTTLAGLEKDYPDLAEKITVEYVEDFVHHKEKILRPMGDAYAVYYDNKIYLNKGEFAKPTFKQTLLSDEIKGWSPLGTGNVKGIIEHEFGHAMLDHVEARGRKDFKVMHDFLATMNIIANNPVSDYAKTDTWEGFAEGFAAMRSGMSESNASVISIKGLVSKYGGNK